MNLVRKFEETSFVQIISMVVLDVSIVRTYETV
jgi:hypothetical protein